MKQFLLNVFKLIIVIVVIILGILLVFKIKNDVLEEKRTDEQQQNIQIESEYLTKTATEKIENIKDEIESDIGQKVELADTGNLSQIDIYFVAKVDNQYKNIIKKTVDGKEKFEIAQDNYDDGKYILSIDALGLSECIYTDVNNYIIDTNGIITYLNVEDEI